MRFVMISGLFLGTSSVSFQCLIQELVCLISLDIGEVVGAVGVNGLQIAGMAEQFVDRARRRLGSRGHP